MRPYRRGMRTSPLLVGALLAGALALPTTASAASTPTCFGGNGGQFFAYTKVGTAKPEVLVGTPGRDVIYAGGGDDVIYGLDGDDILCGAGGADVIVGGEGRDEMDGADDPASLRSEAGQRTDDRADRLYGGPGNDNATGLDGDDWVEGGEGNDDIGGGPRPHLVV